MYKLTRLALIASVLLAAYCIVLLTIMIPWAWAAVAVGAVIVLARRGKALWAHGTARWADASDLEGMLDGQGLVVGRIDGKPKLAVWPLFNPVVGSEAACQQFLGWFRRSRKQPLVTLSKAVHTAVFAPPGAGKSTGLVIPYLLTSPESCVVVDLKGELAKVTAKARRAMGHRVVLLDPYKLITPNPDTFNPLVHINPDSPAAIDECRDLAEAMVVRPTDEKEPHWNDNAEKWIAAMAATTVAHSEDDRSLQMVKELIANPEKRGLAMKLMQESPDWQGGVLCRVGHELTNHMDRELGSVLTTTTRHLRFLDTPLIAESTKTSSFNPGDLCKGKMTVYLILPPEHMRAQQGLLRMWISSMLRAVVRGGLSNRRVHFVIDEAAALGSMDAITDALAQYRGYGVRIQLYYQALGQLQKCFPGGQDQTVLSNCTQIYFAVNDNQTAEYVSNRLGEETIVVTSGGTSGGTSRTRGQQGQNSASFNEGWTDNWSQTGRKLLKPEEVMALSERIAITFTQGVPPIWTTLVRYYEENLGKRPGRVWPAFKALVDAVCLLLLVGLLAAALSGLDGVSLPTSGGGTLNDPPVRNQDWLFP